MCRNSLYLRYQALVSIFIVEIFSPYLDLNFIFSLFSHFLPFFKKSILCVFLALYLTIFSLHCLVFVPDLQVISYPAVMKIFILKVYVCLQLVFHM